MNIEASIVNSVASQTNVQQTKLKFVVTPTGVRFVTKLAKFVTKRTPVVTLQNTLLSDRLGSGKYWGVTRLCNVLYLTSLHIQQ